MLDSMVNDIFPKLTMVFQPMSGSRIKRGETKNLQQISNILRNFTSILEIYLAYKILHIFAFLVTSFLRNINCLEEQNLPLRFRWSIDRPTF